MKVLIISLAYTPFIGGAEVALKDITDRIGDVDFDMVTVNLDGKQQKVQKIGNVNIYRVGKSKLDKYFFPFIGFKKAKELYQEKKYDIVWAMMANQSGLVALKMKKKFPAIKYLLTLQEGDSLKRIWSRTWFMRGKYKNIYRKADKIQAISNFLAARAKKYGYKGEVDVIPNGVDYQSFSAQISDEEKVQIRNSLGLSQGDKVLITTSRLVYKNGLDTLITAVRNVDAKLLIVGSGPLESKLRALTQEIEVKDKVSFIGYLDHADMIKYLKVSDVFIRPSRSEGLGSSFIEAMAAGLPIIGTKVGGIPDFLEDGKTGLFCEVDNPSDLAMKIKTLLSDEGLRQTIITNSSELVSQGYSWQSIASQMRELFNKI